MTSLQTLYKARVDSCRLKQKKCSGLQTFIILAILLIKHIKKSITWWTNNNAEWEIKAASD